MKRLISLLGLCVIGLPVVLFAQTKPAAKEKPPTQKEMQEMMKEMQQEMSEMSAEDKKILDSLGIKMPDAKAMQKGVTGVSDAQLSEAYELETRIVPKRSDALIASIAKKVNEATLAGYLAAMHKKITGELPPEVKTIGEKVRNYIQSGAKNSSEAGNMANAIWIAGRATLALYVMGKICIDDPLNTDNLSNYAAMLSMSHGQHLAIPILNMLNQKFPGNSTLLNNLGQAWFGLGDISKAEKYLDSAIHIYAYHPQANITKAAIEESRGNTTKAVEAIKRSIKHAYTNEKEDMLRKLGYNITLNDLKVPFKPGPDPLGLRAFKRPDYPASLNELKSLKPLWIKFNNEIDAKLAQLQTQSKALHEQYEKNISKSLNATVPLHFKKASLQVNDRMSYYEVQLVTLAEDFRTVTEELQKIQATHKRAPPEAPCYEIMSVQNEYLKKYNELKQSYDEQALDKFRRIYNDLAYWSQFTSTDKNQFDIVVLNFQEDWLRKLKEYQPLLYSESENLECTEEEEAKPGKLPDFDVVACNYKDTMDLKLITFYQNCSRMTSKLNLKFAEYTRYDDFNRAEDDTYVGSTIKVSAEKGFESLEGKAGPVKVEAKVGASVEMEFDRDGIKDITLAVEAKAGAGYDTYDEGLKEGGSIGGKDLIDTSVEIGVEGRISIISGKGSIKRTGMFENIKITEW